MSVKLRTLSLQVQPQVVKAVASFCFRANGEQHKPLTSIAQFASGRQTKKSHAQCVHGFPF